MQTTHASFSKHFPHLHTGHIVEHIIRLKLISLLHMHKLQTGTRASEGCRKFLHIATSRYFTHLPVLDITSWSSQLQPGGYGNHQLRRWAHAHTQLPCMHMLLRSNPRRPSIICSGHNRWWKSSPSLANLLPATRISVPRTSLHINSNKASLQAWSGYHVIVLKWPRAHVFVGGW